MALLRRLRPVLYVAGFGLAVGSLLGARALTAGNSPAADAPKSAAGQAGTTRGTGPVVLGTVDSDPQPIPYGLPPVLQSGTVAEVFVKDGQEIKKAGDKLYAFDASIQLRDLDRAKAAVKMAETKRAEAVEEGRRLGEKIKVVKQGVELAKTRSQLAANQYNLVRNNLFTLYKAERIPDANWEDRLKDDPKALEALSAWTLAKGDWDLKEAELNALRASARVVPKLGADGKPKIGADGKPEEETTIPYLLGQAEAGVKQAEAEVAKAQTAVDLCVVTAKTPGTVEQLTISPGATMGISTRTPALWLIPAGPRVVRAEVEAEFAHRVTQDLIGKEVVVADNTDPRQTYTGRVRRVGGTFLPKRSAADALVGSDTRVLEAVIEVLDDKPAGKPPLRVGQRVRVTLGQ